MKKYFIFLTFAMLALLKTDAHAALNRGFYASCHGGVNWHYLNNLNSGFNSCALDTSTGYFGGAAVGYQFCPYIISRAELELTYRSNSLEKFHYYVGSAEMKGDISSFACLFNSYYDFDLNCRFSPYWGIGLGYSHIHLNSKHENGEHYKYHTNNFAFQFMAGINYSLCENILVGLDYRYFEPGKHLKNHSLGLSLKRFF